MLKINSPEVLQVEVEECGEQMVDLLDLPMVYLPSRIETDIGISDSQNMVARKSNQVAN